MRSVVVSGLLMASVERPLSARPTVALWVGCGLRTARTHRGTFGGIAYVQYDGIFAGQTSTGAYRVPYRITAPANLRLANRTVVVEPPHGSAGLGALNVKTIQELGFANHREYLKAFADKVADYVKAGYMINEDATAMRNRAALCPR